MPNRPQKVSRDLLQPHVEFWLGYRFVVAESVAETGIIARMFRCVLNDCRTAAANEPLWRARAEETANGLANGRGSCSRGQAPAIPVHPE